jgi:hypothetical protein
MPPICPSCGRKVRKESIERGAYIAAWRRGRRQGYRGLPPVEDSPAYRTGWAAGRRRWDADVEAAKARDLGDETPEQQPFDPVKLDEVIAAGADADTMVRHGLDRETAEAIVRTRESRREAERLARRRPKSSQRSDATS